MDAILKITARVIERRLQNGEQLEAIFKSYPKLTSENQQKILEFLNKN